MKKQIKFLTLLVSVLALSVSSAYAVVPTIDGIFSAGEWDAFIAIAGDPNEGTIADAYDFSGMRIILEDSGAASDGVYVLLTTYAAPSLVDTGAGFPPASVSFNLDSGDGDFTDASDFFTVHLLTGFTVFDGTGSSILTGTEGTHFKLGSVIEYFIPESVLTGAPFGTFFSFANYDNGGDDPDDRIPNSGFATNIPEPGTMMLLGSGLLGLMGLRRFSR